MISRSTIVHMAVECFAARLPGLVRISGSSGKDDQQYKIWKLCR